MKVIGITGGIGSGKSTVINILKEKYGVNVLLADNLGHKAMEKESPAYCRMVGEFGEGILAADKEIDRKKLAEILFSDEKKLAKQNSIVHPFVRKEIEKQLKEWEKSGEKLAAVESAILVEAGCHEQCDEIWLVTASKEIRIERLMTSRGYSRQKAETIMKKQKSDEEYMQNCDKVIINDKDIENLNWQLEKSIEQLIAM